MSFHLGKNDRIVQVVISRNLLCRYSGHCGRSVKCYLPSEFLRILLPRYVFLSIFFLMFYVKSETDILAFSHNQIALSVKKILCLNKVTLLNVTTTLNVKTAVKYIANTLNVATTLNITNTLNVTTPLNVANLSVDNCRSGMIMTYAYVYIFYISR